MTLTLSIYDKVLKDDYEDAIRTVLNDEIAMLKEFEKDSGSYIGRAVVWPVTMNRNEGMGAIGDNDDLPTAQNMEDVESRLTAKYEYGRVSVSGPTIATSKNNKGAFAKAMDKEIKGMLAGLKKDINRQLFGDGYGALCQCNGAGSPSTTLIVDNDSNRFLRKNMFIDVYTAKTGGSIEVTAQQISAKTGTTQVTIPSSTWSNNSFVFRKNSRGKEIMGLRGIIDDGTYRDIIQTISRTSYPDWKAVVKSNGGVARALTLDLMQQALDGAGENGGDPKLIVAHTSVRRSYINLLSPDIRYSPLELRGGFKELKYAGGKDEMPFKFDYDAPYGEIFFIDKSSIKLYVLTDFEWASDDGSVLSRVLNKDAWEAFLRYFAELGTDNPGWNAVLRDISATV